MLTGASKPVTDSERSSYASNSWDPGHCRDDGHRRRQVVEASCGDNAALTWRAITICGTAWSPIYLSGSHLKLSMYSQFTQELNKLPIHESLGATRPGTWRWPLPSVSTSRPLASRYTGWIKTSSVFDSTVWRRAKGSIFARSPTWAKPFSARARSRDRLGGHAR
jgi:hypothetical protein